MLLVLPVAREFGADISTTQWILNAYALAVGMVVVAGGRLADMYGRRRAHLVGVSAGGGIAQALALDAPDRVVSLVLISSSPVAPVDRPLPSGPRLRPRFAPPP